jgi:polyisoprenoid-binding protein YceI
MKTVVFLALSMLSLLQPTVAQNIYSTDKGYLSFYSKAPVADVDARNGKVKVRLNSSTQELTFDVKMSDFEFKNAKMGRDARKKYIEIDEYPKAGFRGKITGDVDYEKAGTYTVSATGNIKIHGVEKHVTEKGKVTIQKGKISLSSEFYVQLKDHKIETPKILGHEMTEDRMLVKVEATLTPIK